jgi:Fe-S-cluster-containing dehydrogenase component
MAITRREALVQIAKGTAVAGCVTALSPLSASAHEAQKLSPQRMGLLYDATYCVGCKSCMVACAKVNHLDPDTRTDALHIHQAPHDLNNRTKNIIKVFNSKDGKEHSYLKQQCMQCNDPACVAACMFHGLTKDELTGVVSWNGMKCVGCRYCEVACPFHVPSFRWEGFNPEIVKCELCRHITGKGQLPGCASVCPTHAVIYGRTEDLLAEAKRRIAAEPGKYYQDRVYGEKEAGGTQCLYLSHLPYADLGLTEDEPESVPSRLKFQHMLYKYMALPLALYVGMTAVISKNFGHVKHELEEGQKKTGLREQL